MATRWGIVSAGKISNDFVECLKAKSPEEHEIIAVAARKEDDAKNFACRHKIPNAYGSYELLAQNEAIEVVYVGAIHPMHFKLTKMMLEAGKHVLCEKPLCLHPEEVKFLTDLSREKNKFLMEGVWSRCFPIYDELRDHLMKKSLGNIEAIEASFGFPLLDVPRVKEAQLGGGAIFDMGIYAIQLAVLVGGNNIAKISAKGELNEEGVDILAEINIQFDQGPLATLHVSAKEQYENKAVIRGSNGVIEIDDPFWCPTLMRIQPSGERIIRELPFKCKNHLNFTNSEGLLFEADEVRQCIKKGVIESDKMKHSDSLLISNVIKNCCEQIGVTVLPSEAGS